MGNLGMDEAKEIVGITSSNIKINEYFFIVYYFAR